jgi:hypothetical protein
MSISIIEIFIIKTCTTFQVMVLVSNAGFSDNEIITSINEFGDFKLLDLFENFTRSSNPDFRDSIRFGT